jgi:hypothetical protein
MMRRGLLVVLALAVCASAFAGSERQRITYRDFSGGWNSSTDFDAIQPNQLKKAYNILIEKDRSIRGRIGYSTWYSIPTSVIATNTAILSMVPNNQALLYVDATGKAFTTPYQNIYVPTNANGQYADIAKLGDYYVFGSTGDYLQYISSSTALVGSSTAVPGAVLTNGIVKAHNDRIFTAYRAGLYETAVASAADFSGGEAWAIGEESEGEITGLGEIGEDLYIFKTNAIYRMTGYSPAERRVELLSSSYGTQCPKSIVSADLTGIGKCLVFFSSSSQFCVLTPSGITPISEAIQETLDRYTLGNGTKGCWGEFEASRQGVLFTFCRGETNGLGFYLNGGVSYQAPAGIRWPFTVYGNPDVYQSPAFWGVCKSANVNSGDYWSANDLTVVMTPSNLLQDQKKICRSYLNKGQYISRDDNTGTTTSYPMAIQTRDEDAGDIRTWKGWRKATSSGFFRYTIDATHPVGTYTQRLLNTTVLSAPLTILGPTSVITENTMPLYNFNETCSLEMAFSTYNVWWLTQITIDFVKGPKQE